MRQISLIATVLCLLVTTSFSPNISYQNEKPLTKEEKLFYTCKIWGFLKYYHPLVAKGSYNWDEKLHNVINITKSFETSEELSNYFSRWIYNMGPVPPCKTCNRPGQNKYFSKNFDLSWLENPAFTQELTNRLRSIEKNRFQGDHNYIGVGDIQEFEPKNEPMDLFQWNQENQRLMVLFRYWNYIEYFYPHKYQMDQSWDDVLKEMIPKFIAAKTKLDVHLAMLELIVKTDDSHAGLITNELNAMPYYNYLPARIDLVENQVVVTEIVDAEKSKAADLQVGDVIKTINGEPAIRRHEDNKKYIWGSNKAIKDRSMYHTLFMGLTESPELTIERTSGIINVNATLYQPSQLSYEKKNVDKWKVIDDSVGYVDVGQLRAGEVGPMMEELMENAAIIFDVRNNPKGVYGPIAKYLLPADTTFAVYTKPDLSYPGKFIWNGEANCGNENPDHYKGLVILLVNENTQNHAEFTCMCLQAAPRVVTIGSQTAGSNGKITRFPLVNRIYTSMTGIGIFYADGSETQRVGIVPDIDIKPTIAGIRERRDEVLEKALEVANDEVERLLEIARQEELARLAEIARLEELARIAAMDSLRLDSLQHTMPLDSMAKKIEIDSLKLTSPLDSLERQN